MKEKVTVSLIQFSPLWLEREENAERMKKLAEEAAANGAELIVFPELSNIGYITPARPGQPATFGAGVSANEFAVKYIEASESVPGPTTDLL